MTLALVSRPTVLEMSTRPGHFKAQRTSILVPASSTSLVTQELTQLTTLFPKRKAMLFRCLRRWHYCSLQKFFARVGWFLQSPWLDAELACRLAINHSLLIVRRPACAAKMLP